MRRLVVLAVAVLALAGCGGSKAPVSDTTTYGPTVYTAQQMMANAGCKGDATLDTQLELYVKESGTCTLDGQQISVDTFNNKAARDAYLKVAETFGGSYGEGDLWVIHGDDAATVAKAVASASGTML